MIVVILAGGSGTRFWPLSRRTRPKQLLDIMGNHSLITETVRRALKLKPERILVVTGADQAERTRELLRSEKAVPKGGPTLEVLVEPRPRNTAPAVAFAARRIADLDPKAVMAVLPADHHIRNLPTFIRVMKDAEAVAKEGFLVTLGIATTRPETGYGYIFKGKEGILGGFRVAAFKEKPPYEEALRYHADPDHFWNSGMFVWQAQTFLKECRRLLPDFTRELDGLKGLEPGTEKHNVRLHALFEHAPSISVDYAILEKSKKVAMVPAPLKWSDVGSWPSLYELLSGLSGRQLVSRNEVLPVASGSAYVHAPKGKFVALVGVKDLVVVDTGDALLVASLAAGQEVGEVVKHLRAKGREELL